MPAKTINISQDAVTQQAYVLTERIRADGYLSSGFIHFPPGCRGFVDVRVSIQVAGSYVALAPADDVIRNVPQFIHIDDFTIPFPIDLEVKARDMIRVEIRNRDLVNDHEITVLVFWWDHKPAMMEETSVLMMGIKAVLGVR